MWLVAASAVDNSILLAGPGDTLAAFAALLADAGFWAAVAQSGGRIVGAALAASAAGAVLGLIAGRFPAARYLTDPLVQIAKSAPVACVTVVLLVALGSRGAVAAIIAFVALPPFYAAALQALTARDRDAEQVLRLAGASRGIVFLACIWPACLPFFQAAARTAFAMAWRAGVTGELLAIPLGSIGAGVFAAKLTLDTAGLLAWTIAVMLLGWASEKLFAGLLSLTKGSPSLALAAARRRRARRRPGCGDSAEGDAAPGSLGAFAASKTFDGRRVLDDVSLAVAPDSRVCLMAPTGSGKTTLIRLLVGLEFPDAGEVAGVRRGGVVLQQPCLVEGLSARENVVLTAAASHGEANIADALGELLPEGTLDRPVRELSGGTRRLVEIARAVFSPGTALVLDEPFAGLDPRAKERACSFILDRAAGRPVLVATHDAGDAAQLDATVFRLHE